jgi:hypothetical protein
VSYRGLPYETLAGKNELYKLIQEGIDDIKNGRILAEEEVLKNMELALQEASVNDKNNKYC